MSEPSSPRHHRIESIHTTHSYEVDQTPSYSVEQKNERSNIDKEFSIDSLFLSEIPSPNNPNPRKITLVILAVLAGCFVAYRKRKPALPPIQPILPPKQYHLTGKIKTTITPKR